MIGRRSQTPFPFPFSFLPVLFLFLFLSCSPVWSALRLDGVSGSVSEWSWAFIPYPKQQPESRSTNQQRRRRDIVRTSSFFCFLLLLRHPVTHPIHPSKRIPTCPPAPLASSSRTVSAPTWMSANHVRDSIASPASRRRCCSSPRLPSHNGDALGSILNRRKKKTDKKKTKNKNSTSESNPNETTPAPLALPRRLPIRTRDRAMAGSCGSAPARLCLGTVLYCTPACMQMEMVGEDGKGSCQHLTGCRPRSRSARPVP